MKSGIAFLFHLMSFYSLVTSTNKRRIFYGENVTTKNPLIANLLYDEGEDSGSISIRLKQSYGRDSDYYHLLCGGLIVSDFYVLTAGHCIMSGWDRLHLVGVDGLNFREMAFYHRVTDKIAHPNYVYQGKSDNDIGLVKTLSRMAKLGPPTRFNPSVEYISNHPIILYGWGLTEKGESSEDLKQIQLKHSTDMGNCRDAPAVKAGRVLCFYALKKGASSGPGDSGSPIIMNAVSPSGQNVILSLGAVHVGPRRFQEPIDRSNRTSYVLGPNLTYYFDWMVQTINKK